MRAILFDLDDTLYPEREYVLSGFRAAAQWGEQRLGIHAQAGFTELERLFLSGVRGNTFDQWLALHNIDAAGLAAEIVCVYREHKPIIHLFPGVMNVIIALRKHYCLGLVSDGYQKVQQYKIDALGIERLFDSIVLSDALGRNAWKPSPRPFQVALQKLNAPAFSAVYVGDNPAKDFLGARRAGIASIRIVREASEHALDVPETPEHAPDCTIKDLRDLPELLSIPANLKPSP